MKILSCLQFENAKSVVYFNFGKYIFTKLLCANANDYTDINYGNFIVNK